MATAKKAPVNAFLRASPKAQLKDSLKNVSHKDVPGLAAYATVDFTIKELTALLKVKKVPLLVQANQKFLDFVSEKHKLVKGAANFKGKEGKAEASFEARKRGTNSPLKPEEKEHLELQNIRFLTVPPTFAFNAEMAAKYPQAMEKIGQFIGSLNLPDDFVEVLPGKDVVSDESLEDVAKLNDPAAIAALLPVVLTPAIKPTATDDDVEDRLTLAKALTRVLEMVTENHKANVAE
jgi:hypothetical protein